MQGDIFTKSFNKKNQIFVFRDFAYVAKDKDRSVRIYKCHVFRCDNTSARTIANTLRDICRNLMIERGLLTETTEIFDDDLSAHKR
jgi:hypothetical protein